MSTIDWPNIDARVAVLCATVFCFSACTDARDPLFQELSPARTGIDFVNLITETATLNINTYLYFYNGGGVAVGDVDNDGLPDLFFTANQGQNRLYRNVGGLSFAEITTNAGVGGQGDWSTGVTMTDVDGDGWLDIYVSVVSGLEELEGHNELFVNNQDGTFTERAAEFGLDLEGFGTHAAFFDYDRDGDLDAFVVNHSVHTRYSYGPASLRHERSERAGDRLMRNDGGRFVDVSEEAGIFGSLIGYGLGAGVGDIDNNGCPDVYVSNDFHENDYLYINNCDGTFTESGYGSLGHMSRFSMGNDIADIDNDGLLDIAVLDMLPEREEILKASGAADPYDIYRLKLRLGYHFQVARNTLQLNRGSTRFSEIGYMAGVSSTDWSWAPLIADFDLDGYQDLFITNGIYRRQNDLDYINFISNEAIQMAQRDDEEAGDLALVERMPRVPIPNYAYRNRGDLSYENVSETWGLDHSGFSNGAAYADLDGDGDLDLVVNHINESASIYENHAADRDAGTFLTVELAGTAPNTAGIGARVTVTADTLSMIRELYASRGWQSSVEPRLYFGLNGATRVDTLAVRWPDGRIEMLTNIAANTTVRVEQAAARPAASATSTPRPWFEDVTSSFAFDFKHDEPEFVDFNREKLIPHKISLEGPALAVGDVNNDGLDDVFLGGAKRQPGSLMLQQASGDFIRHELQSFVDDSIAEDVDAVFLDADGDGDLDLYVVSGGNEFWGQAPALLDRLYLNDGVGNMERATDALPAMHENGGAVAAADYDQDGDTDLFVGGRVVSRQYGQIPQSFLLINDGTGRFTDETDVRGPSLRRIGMVTDADWCDVDGDGFDDLVVVGEWMPITVLVQRSGRLENHTESFGLNGTAGWWSSLLAEDLDQDGDVDLIAGNLGLNSKLKTSPEAPLRLYLKDMDDNGTVDPILSYVKEGVEYPVATRDELVAQMEPLKRRFPSYASYAQSTFSDVFSESELEGAVVRRVDAFASVVAINEAGARFQIDALPRIAQIAPTQAVHPVDIDENGNLDLIIGGNFYGVGPARGRYDASLGQVLAGDGRGGFAAVPTVRTGILFDGDVRAIEAITIAGRPYLIVARNDAPVQFVRFRKPGAAQPEG